MKILKFDEYLNEGLIGKLAKFVLPKEFKKIVEYTKDELEEDIDNVSKNEILEIIKPMLRKGIKKFVKEPKEFDDDSKLLNSLAEEVYKAIKK